MKMTAKDDIEEFTSRIRTEYKETCHLFGLEELDIPLNIVFEVTVTANMNQEGKCLFGNAFRRDAETTIQKIDKAFRNKVFKA